MAFWMDLALPIALTLVWVFGPGLAVTSASRLTPSLRWGLAPMLSGALLTVSAILAPRVGLEWGPLPVLAVTAVATATVWAIRLVCGRLWPSLVAAPRRADDESAPRLSWRAILSDREAITVMAMVLAAGLALGQLRGMLLTADSLSQTYDNIFHQSLARYFVETGNASMLTASGMNTPENPAFYPALWHAIVSLGIITTGAVSTAVWTNALIIVTCAFVWPASIILFTRALMPAPLARIGLLGVGIASVALPTFPYLLLFFGVLYPNLLGLALMPALMVPVARLIGLAPEDRIGFPTVILLGALGSLGVAMAHPNAALTFIALTIALSLSAAVTFTIRMIQPASRTRAHALHIAWALGIAALSWGMARILWPLAQPSEAASGWRSFQQWPDAVADAVFAMPPHSGEHSLILGVLLLLGLYACLRFRRLAPVAVWATAVYLWVAASAWPMGEGRRALVGVWYNDPYRLSAIAGVAGTILVAYGSALVITRASELASRIAHARSTTTRENADLSGVSGPSPGALGLVPVALAAVATVVLAVLTTTSGAMTTMVDMVAENYELHDESELLTADESALIHQIPELIPADSIVLTDAWNGSSMLYPLTGMETTSHHAIPPESDPQSLLYLHLDDIDSRPDVCEAVRATGATYVLDFGRQQINGQQWPRPGWNELNARRGFIEVAREGSAALYTIPDC